MISQRRPDQAVMPGQRLGVDAPPTRLRSAVEPSTSVNKNVNVSKRTAKRTRLPATATERASRQVAVDRAYPLRSA
jgi:hypothetical protein